ncbi:MAG: cytochrome c [Nitrospirota bacterium]|nr:cytochrome c [Nitrospirota bacterium]
MRRAQHTLFGLWAVLGLGIAWAEGAPVWAAEGDAANAELLYKTYCVQCHGATGKGNGINVRDMSVQPRDHTDAAGMVGLSDDRLFKAIKEGGPAVTKSVLMPPWAGVLTDEEVHGLVRHLRVLCACEGRG